MNRKMTTVLIDLTTLGEYVEVPINAEPEVKASLIAHNQQVRLYRGLVADSIAQQATSLGFRVHVGSAGVLLRGREARLFDITLPEVLNARDASDRWNPRPN